MCDAITTHVLDTARGTPAVGIEVTLERYDAPAAENVPGRWRTIGGGITNAEGRIMDLLPASETRVDTGIYRLTFATGAYFAAQHISPVFYPQVTVEFAVPTSETGTGYTSYHVPLLISPYSFTSYRGS
jgi:5-hydroxyisourate hydrolase